MITSNDRKVAGLLLPAVIALLGVACGGGGDAGSPTSPSGTSVAEVEYESYQLANSARQDSGIQPLLDLDEALARVARVHSEAMRDEGFFGHHGSAGGLRARLRSAGIQFSAAGENLARLSSVPNPAGEAHEQFLQSAEHREVMLDPRFRLVGVGVARSGSNYWLTQIYIRP